ncbi:tetratricopeptide repeat protein [Leucobacter sp. wl10]|uniref:tetratricopeptide repeat protein n=1 Tax=Leucobacter sp. wl10 TaxID=2304677 RepID=UPI000E5BB73B|nr:tetratricopeptide repeat protein [Leucobacter sp. wl10]RGE20746.1 tetratricopeptide repeat protein [Leucobacter sp. wl10]
MSAHDDIERAAIERDRDLAWELYDVRPEHPRIPELAQSVLAREPTFTGMIILTALHREACGEVEEARRLLQDLMGRRDRQYLNVLKKLRDLEFSDENYAEALRLAEMVLREHPEADWMDRMDYGSALIFTGDPGGGWRVIDEAVESTARVDPEQYAMALGQRATRLLASGAPPERFLPAAEEALAADPSDPILATTLAYAYLYHYRAEEAEGLFRRVLREDPTDEVAQGGMIVARAFLDPIERGVRTMDDHRRAGTGEMAWRTLRDQMFGTGLVEALVALDAVMPEALAASLRPPLDRETARDSGGEWRVLAWHDGQEPGTGALWGAGDSFRLMTAAEIGEMDEAIERDRGAWSQWDEEEYYTQIFTDDAGAYLIEGRGGRLIRRARGEADREVAPSLADRLWDRVVALGGEDPRPGRP